jgi:hypothetical protein
MLHDDARADLMRGLPGVGTDFQDLAEGAKRLSGYLGRVIRARVGDDNDP